MLDQSEDDSHSGGRSAAADARSAPIVGDANINQPTATSTALHRTPLLTERRWTVDEDIIFLPLEP